MRSPATYSLDDITAGLRADGFEYQLEGHSACDLFAFMSIMNIQPNGIFYAIGTLAGAINFHGSIILTDVNLAPPPECVVIRLAKPQLAFYRLMNRLVKDHEKVIPGIHPTVVIGANTNIHPSASIGPHCHLEDCEIGANVVLKPNVTVMAGSIIEENVTVDAQSVIGAQGVAWVYDADREERVMQPQIGYSHVGRGTFLGAGTIIVRGSVNETTSIGQNCFVAPGVRIGHGCQIGNDCHFANNIAIGGNTRIGDGCFLGVSCSIRPQIKLADFTVVAAGAVVVKDCIKEHRLLMGVPATEHEKEKQKLSGVPRR